ncbi:hypothetical protein TNCV_2245891 [Trichonephila clavipes]|uniref:Uncharacterized protein n=1 Tax=Trichonephila clavipes TaxID=2585209 RepID=A0A8X6V1J9_TRICX|nr:hypothetical protein TNCV_2245891 [Trichonephila clavipes]
MVLLTNLESFTLNNKCGRSPSPKLNSIAARLPKIAFPSDTVAVNTIDQFDLLAGRSPSPKLNSIAARLPKIAFPSDTVAVNTIDQFDLLAGRSPSPKLNSIAARLPKIAFPSDTVAVNTIDQFDLLAGRSPSPKLNSIAARLPKMSFSPCVAIVRVQYFVRGGFVGHRSRANSKHLSSHLPVDMVRSTVKKGLRCSCKMHVWVSGPTKMPTTLDVRRSDVTGPRPTVPVSFFLTLGTEVRLDLPILIPQKGGLGKSFKEEYRIPRGGSKDPINCTNIHGPGNENEIKDGLAARKEELTTMVPFSKKPCKDKNNTNEKDSNKNLNNENNDKGKPKTKNKRAGQEDFKPPINLHEKPSRCRSKRWHAPLRTNSRFSTTR